MKRLICGEFCETIWRLTCFYFCTFRNSETFVLRQWQRVRVGDFIQLPSDEEIPADILLLRSSDPSGICYIETANIDGETNLKQRQVPSGVPLGPGVDMDADAGLEGVQKFNPMNFSGEVYCEQPHKKIYDFNGYM
jgi:phospholipid-translocating ATPase